MTSDRQPPKVPLTRGELVIITAGIVVQVGIVILFLWNAVSYFLSVA